MSVRQAKDGDMRIVSNKMLLSFSALHPPSYVPLQAWRKIIETGVFNGYADFKKSFNSVDKVGHYYVFDIAGNKYRLVSSIHFNTQMLFVRHVFTHGEYDDWRP